MARSLPKDDQDWSDIHRREEPPKRVTLPAWSWLALVFLFAFWLRSLLVTLLDGPALGTWTTIFVSISVQALPFLVLGVVLSGAITALVPAARVAGQGAAQDPDQPSSETPLLLAESIRVIDQPSPPYESGFPF